MPGYTSAKDVLTILSRQNYICAGKGCETKLIYENKKRVNWIVEHLHATGRGGSNELSNKSGYCKECAAAKTWHPRSKASTISSDLFEINKTKTLERIRKHGKAPSMLEGLPS